MKKGFLDNMDLERERGITNELQLKKSPALIRKEASASTRMSANIRLIQERVIASFTDKNLNPVEVQEGEVQVVQPRVTRNTTRGTRGRMGGRTGGCIGRPRNPTTNSAPTDNLSEEISRVLMNTLPLILKQVADDRREEEQERFSKEANELRSKLDEEAIRNQANLWHLKEEIERLRSESNRVPNSRTRGCSYKEFVGSKPPEFSGKCDPIAVANWVSEMETIFEVSGCAEEQKVLYTNVVLKGDALRWWKMIKESSNGEVSNNMSWAAFKVLFMKKFSPNSEVRQLEVEFLKLSQENKTVHEYAAKFIEKARFAR